MGVYEGPLPGAKPIQKTPLHSPVVPAIPTELRVPLDYEDRRASLGDFAFRLRFRVRLLLIGRLGLVSIGRWRFCKCVACRGQNIGDGCRGSLVRPCARRGRRNNRLAAGVVDDAFRPFLFGLNADQGRIDACPLRTGQSGQDQFAISSTASNAPLTQRKYRARGIRSSAPCLLKHLLFRTSLTRSAANLATRSHHECGNGERCLLGWIGVKGVCQKNAPADQNQE